MANKWAQTASEWYRFALEARKEWDELTDEELMQLEGKRNTLASMVHKRYFISKKGAHTQIEVRVDEL